MNITHRLLLTGWIAAVAATAHGQNLGYLGDHQSLDREQVDAAALPSFAARSFAGQSRGGQPAVRQPITAQNQRPTRAQSNIKPREERKRTTLFGMLTSSWNRGDKKESPTPPPAPGAAFRKQGAQREGSVAPANFQRSPADVQGRRASPSPRPRTVAPMVQNRWKRKPSRLEAAYGLGPASAPTAPQSGAGLPNESFAQHAPVESLQTPEAPLLEASPPTPPAPAPRATLDTPAAPAQVSSLVNDPAKVAAGPVISALVGAPEPSEPTAEERANVAAMIELSTADSLDDVVFVSDEEGAVSEASSGFDEEVDTVAFDSAPDADGSDDGEQEDLLAEIEPADAGAVALDAPPIVPLPPVAPTTHCESDQTLKQECESEKSQQQVVETPVVEAVAPVVAQQSQPQVEPQPLATNEAAEKVASAEASDLEEATPESVPATTPQEPVVVANEPAVETEEAVSGAPKHAVASDLPVVVSDSEERVGRPELRSSLVDADATYRPIGVARQRRAESYEHPRLGLPSRRPTPETQPSDRSKALLSEAHEIAQGAAAIDDYTAIIQRCRYVLAIDKAPQAIEYSHQLASWALNCRGEVLMEEGRDDEAEGDFHDAIGADKNCWRAEHNLGVIDMQRGEIGRARRRFNRTIELNPEYAKAYSNRATLSVQSGDYAGAMRDYSRAIEADPDLAVAHTGRGRLCHMLGYLKQALRHLDAAAILAPEDATIAIARADLLVDFGRYGPARTAYQRAIALEPHDPTAYRNLAWLQATCPIDAFRDGDAAVVNAERAAELSVGQDDIALDTYAAALAAVGRFEEAAEVQLQAVELAPQADAEAYLERLARYMKGEPFTSRPLGGVVQQASYSE